MSGRVGYSNVTTNGLVFYLDAGNKISYPGSGTTWYDISKYNNHATLYNGATYNNDGGGCIIFDGTDDYAQTLQNISGFFPENSILNNLTFSAWMKSSNISNFGGNFLMNFGDNPNWYFAVTIELGIYPGKICLYSDRWTTSNATLSSNVWYNVVGTFQPNLTTLYLNGVLDRADNTVGSSSAYSPSPPANPLSIGTRYNTYRMNGKIANLMIYNRTLSATEVSQNYNALKGRFGL